MSKLAEIFIWLFFKMYTFYYLSFVYPYWVNIFVIFRNCFLMQFFCDLFYYFSRNISSLFFISLGFSNVFESHETNECFGLITLHLKAKLDIFYNTVLEKKNYTHLLPLVSLFFLYEIQFFSYRSRKPFVCLNISEN